MGASLTGSYIGQSGQLANAVVTQPKLASGVGGFKFAFLDNSEDTTNLANTQFTNKTYTIPAETTEILVFCYGGNSEDGTSGALYPPNLDIRLGTGTYDTATVKLTRQLVYVRSDSAHGLGSPNKLLCYYDNTTDFSSGTVKVMFGTGANAAGWTARGELMLVLTK